MSDLALHLIAENKRSRDTFLDLHNCDLSEVPTEVGELVWLESLIVSGTEVADLAPVVGLSNLLKLDLRNTKVKSLTLLASLSVLQTLDVSNTKVADLAPLAGLVALQVLRLSGTKVRDLSPLASLSALQSLDVSSTEVTDLAPLAGLSNLQKLYVSVTRVTDLAPLVRLSALHELDVRNTQVGDLAPLAVLSALKTVFVAGCDLTNPPPEIVNQGNDAIINYLRERTVVGVDHLYEAKMLIVGEGGAGKTSLLRRLYQPGEELPTESETTRGISIHKHKFELKTGQVFRLNVWDFGGQEIYHATHQFFLTHRSLYLLVDDTRKDYKSVSDEGFKYWLELIDVFGGHSPTLIFQNEKGGRSKAIDFEGIKHRYDNVQDVYKGNLENRDAADDLREGIEFYASHLSHIGEELPARWIQVRADIEACAEDAPYIPVQDYFKIYRRHMDFDRPKALWLSRYLHDLGVFLHFQDDPLLVRTVILQNEWATKAVFRILDDETVKTQLGRFKHVDCERLWQDPTYADMHLELLALMENFELCYKLRDSNPPTWLAPQLLPPAKPKELAGWGNPEDLVLRYRYDFLPKGMISRLTVRLHRFVRNPEMAWVTGVLFAYESTAVLVEILVTGGEIELRARGPEHKALLSVVAADLDALNESFQGLRDKVDKRIPCNCEVCRAAPVPEFFEQKELVRRKEHKKLKVECRRSFKEVDVRELLDGIKVDKLPGWAADQREIRIFLASSSELSEDRDQFDLYFRQQNDHLRKKGIYLEIIRWENFLDAMSETRMQNDYNKIIRDCDIFVCLFFTKTGKFTEEEFDVAHRRFLENRKPLIYTFFKKADVDIDSLNKEDFDSLRAFQAKLNKLGHFYTTYKNIEHLQRQFRDQLDKLLEQHE